MYVKGNLPGWIWPLISKSNAVFELVPVATKQLALFIAKPATVYHWYRNRDALSWDLFCSIQKIEMFIRCRQAMGFIALPIVYLVRLDELRPKKSFCKLFQANVCQS